MQESRFVVSWISKILRPTHRDGTSGSHPPALDGSMRIATPLSPSEIGLSASLPASAAPPSQRPRHRSRQTGCPSPLVRGVWHSPLLVWSLLGEATSALSPFSGLWFFLSLGEGKTHQTHRKESKHDQPKAQSQRDARRVTSTARNSQRTRVAEGRRGRGVAKGPSGFAGTP